MSDSKVLYPVGPTRRPVPIHREAREAADRAIAALRDLHDEDPYVFAALVELGWRGKPLSNRRSMLRLVRARAHEMKLLAVMASIPAREERAS